MQPCTKEAEIATIAQDVAYIRAEVTEIKHKLLGNGKPGIVDEISEFKGTINMLKWSIGVGIPVFITVIIFAVRFKII